MEPAGIIAYNISECGSPDMQYTRSTYIVSFHSLIFKSFYLFNV